MAAKASGALFKKFYNDKAYWPEDSYHDDAVIKVNGVIQEDGLDEATLQDTDLVTVEGGYVVSSNQNFDGRSLETHLKRWLKEQVTVSFVVTCDKSIEQAVREAVKAAGGKI